jgi:glyoxylase-like metal-dependent hydrolase (beta-lactamase superfamily II)
MSLVPLDTGVHAWLADEPGDGRPNAGLVVDADAATVVDTLCVPSQTAAFVAAVEQLGLRVRRTVLTGSTIEFVGGTAMFTMSGMYGRRQTSVHLDQPPTPDVYRRLFPAVAAEFDDEMQTKPVSHVVQEPVQLTPAVTLHPFAGAQAENLVAVVDGAGLAFAGAMATFGVTPWCYQGDPGRWADELDRLVELAPVIVPGHGPIGGEEEVRDLQAYLRACVAAEGDPAAIPPGPWDTWRHREHDEVNVERAAMLSRGDTIIPPSMLRIAGLA